MPNRGKRLQRVVATLAKLYGPPPPPPVTEPLEMILYESIAYLATDEKRLAAWKEFRRRIGAGPDRVLAASASDLLAITRAGILAADRVETVRAVAETALREFGGDLAGALDASPGTARKALARFPGIGEPGAEKILLFSRRERVLALDSNGLRVLLRLGYGEEAKSYAASYRSAREATRGEWRDGFDWLIRAHQLLRRHGQELCRRARPLCERCPLTRDCAYFRSRGSEA